MTIPVLGSVAQELYDRLEPLQFSEVEFDYPLAKLCKALADNAQEIDDYVRDTEDGKPGWSLFLDADRAPLKALPWLGQLVGVNVDTSLSEANQRLQIKAAIGFERGTRGAIIAAIQPYLTGTKTVLFHERDTSAYHLAVNTRTSETPDPVKVNAVLQEAKPAGLVLVHGLVAGWDFVGVNTAYASFNALNAAHTSFNDLREGP